MIPTAYLFAGLLSIAAVISVGVAAYIFVNHRETVGSRWLLAMLVFAAVYAAGYALQILFVDVAMKMLWARVVATGTLLSVSTWFLFVTSYSGYDNWLTKGRTALVLAVPVLTVVLAWTNHFHELVWGNPTTIQAWGAPLLSTDWGGWFLVAFGYGYFLLFVSVALTASLYVRSRSVHQGQAMMLLLAALIPWLGSLVYYLVGRKVLPVDITPLLFTATGGLVAVALTRYQMLDIVPVSQDVLLEQLEDGVVVLDDQDRIVHLNAAAESLFPEQVVGERMSQLLPDGGVETDEVVGTEIRLTPDDDPRYFDLRRTPFSDHRGTQQGELLVFRDITARKEREQALAEYKSIFETVFDRVYVLDEEGVVRHANDPLASMLGTTPDEMVDQHATEFIAPVAYERGNEVIRDLYTSGKRHGTIELELEDSDGNEIPCETYLSLLPFDEEYRGCVGVIRDISERKEAEHELQRTSGTLESLFDAAPLSIVTVDTEYRIERWNPQASETFGWASDAAVGRPMADIFEAAAETLESVCESTLSGTRIAGRELTLTDGSGTNVEVRLAAAPLQDGDGGIDGAVLIFSDITERLQRDQQIAVLNRVLRHNLRNDLGVVLGQVELLGERVDGDRAESHVEMALDRGQTLLDFAQKARQAEQVLDQTADDLSRDVAQLVDSVVQSARSEYPHASIEVGDIPDTSVSVQSTIDIALRNLVENAVEHSDRETPHVGISVTEQEGSVQVTIADDGPGIPESEVAVLHSGTETPLEHGSGIGLWLAHWVVTRSGGTLSFEQNSPRGTIVRITLSATDADATPSVRSVDQQSET